MGKSRIILKDALIGSYIIGKSIFPINIFFFNKCVTVFKKNKKKFNRIQARFDGRASIQSEPLSEDNTPADSHTDTGSPE